MSVYFIWDTKLSTLFTFGEREVYRFYINYIDPRFLKSIITRFVFLTLSGWRKCFEKSNLLRNLSKEKWHAKILETHTIN